MKSIAFLLLLLVGRLSYGQTTIEIENQTGITNAEYKINRLSNPYSKSQELIKKETLVKRNTIVFQPQQDLEKIILTIGEQSYFFYTEPGSLYNLTVKNLDTLSVGLNEENSSINKALSEVDEQFESLLHIKRYFDGTRENALGWLHLGRSKKQVKSAVGMINKNIKSIKKHAWYNDNNNAYIINLYLTPYVFVEDFKNDQMNENLNKAGTIFQNIEEDISNPIFAESFKFFYGYSLRQNFMIIPYSSMKLANEDSYKAFKHASDIIEKIKTKSTRQLALLSIYENYYHSYYMYWRAKKEIIEPGLNAILLSPGHSIINDYALALKEELKNLNIGEEVPGFKLISYSGDSVSLKDLRGKYVYLDFWFSGCAPCISAMRSLPSILDKYQDKVYFVSINSYDSFELGKQIAEENGFISIKLHAGKGHSILKDYNIQYYPTYYLISPEGKLLYKPVDYYKKELNNVLMYLD